ncbi:hypothetical protein [Stenotrophomonas rhizophila]|uniref:hypothetical protein n=1 Tax=Stenotrophomonas rhizophila TaxID=216778 RepID=UPI0028D74006|nr:hypothetical protein [Stenotrophomonas rhizophila]
MSTHTVSRQHYIRLLNRIIAVAHDGHALHARAVARTQRDDAPLCAVMMRMAGSSAAIIDTLGRHVRQAGGRPARHGTVLGGIRAGFGWLGTVLGDAGIQYVSQGQALRARLIRVLQAALHDEALPGDARQVLEAMERHAQHDWQQLHGRLNGLRARQV